MRHFKDPRFRSCYDALAKDVRDLADKNFQLLKKNPQHPSLRFKRIRGDLWSARVGRHYRALAIKDGDRLQWFWIGSHSGYDKIIK